MSASNRLKASRAETREMQEAEVQARGTWIKGVDVQDWKLMDSNAMMCWQLVDGARGLEGRCRGALCGKEQ
jgi:hypothetical protein